jgi:hypothetical protein
MLATSMGPLLLMLRSRATSTSNPAKRNSISRAKKPGSSLLCKDVVSSTVKLRLSLLG